MAELSGETSREGVVETVGQKRAPGESTSPQGGIAQNTVREGGAAMLGVIEDVPADALKEVEVSELPIDPDELRISVTTRESDGETVERGTQEAIAASAQHREDLRRTSGRLIKTVVKRVVGPGNKTIAVLK